MAVRTVLVVEDSEAEARMLETALRGSLARNAVIVVQNTSDAERYLFSEAVGDKAAPDLVLIDMVKRDEVGMRFLRSVRSNSRTRSVPVVTLSGGLDDGEVQDLYRSGANSYLDRPRDPQEFAILVATAAQYWLRLNISVPAFR